MEKEMHKDAVRMDGGAGMKSQRPEREERLRIGITPGEGLDFDYEVLARLFADTSAFETALPFVYGSARKLVDAARRVGLNEANPIVQRSILDVKGKRLQMVEPERSGDASQRDIYAILQEVVSDLKGGHLRALVSGFLRRLSGGFSGSWQPFPDAVMGESAGVLCDHCKERGFGNLFVEPAD